MTLTKHPRLLARVAGVFYLVIIVCALFAYLYVRGHVIVPGHLSLTAANFALHAQLYRLGFTAAVLVVVSNPPMGLIICELLRVVNARLARLALLFIVIATAIEAVNLLNYVTPLVIFTLPDVAAAFTPDQRQALAHVPLRLFGYMFEVSLSFFGVYCALVGYLIIRSGFLPAVLGAMMIAAGAAYWTDNLTDFLALPSVPYVGFVTLIAESALALWLLVMGVDEAKWRAQAEAAA
jgi:hypothetical protein